MRSRLPTVILLVASFLALISGNSNVMGGGASILGSGTGGTGGTGGSPPAPHSSVGHSVVYRSPPSVRYLLVHVIVRVVVTQMIIRAVPVFHVVTHLIQLKPAPPPNGVTTIEVGNAPTSNVWLYGFIGVGGGDLIFLALLTIMSIMSARRSRQGKLSPSHQP